MRRRVGWSRASITLARPLSGVAPSGAMGCPSLLAPDVALTPHGPLQASKWVRARPGRGRARSMASMSRHAAASTPANHGPPRSAEQRGEQADADGDQPATRVGHDIEHGDGAWRRSRVASLSHGNWACERTDGRIVAGLRRMVLYDGPGLSWNLWRRCEKCPCRPDSKDGRVSGTCPARPGEYGHRLRQAGGLAACPAGPGRQWDDEMQLDSAGRDGT